MASSSPGSMAKQLEAQVSRILRGVNTYKLAEKPRKAVAEMTQSLMDARIYTSDYELSETREEQLKNARFAKKWLANARQSMLKASEYNVFGPIDVAHLGAQIDQIIEDLK